jgi:hypothetical protein
MRWHLLNHDGTILRTATAPDKRSAAAILGDGLIVSAISYELDRFHTESDIQRDAIPSGYVSTQDVARQIDATIHQVRRYAILLGLAPVRPQSDHRRRFFWSPSQVRRITAMHDYAPRPTQTGRTVSRRRATFLETMRQRYLSRGPRRRES